MRTTSSKSSKERRQYIAKVKRFARSAAGLKKIDKIAPELAEIIMKHPEYLEIKQFYNDARVSGIYQCKIFGKIFYVGSSGNVVLRLAEHVYNFLTDESAFGGKWDKNIDTHFSIVESGVTIPEIREHIEFACINAVCPVLQYTDPDSPEYGTDKPLLNGETRESLRPDICITPPLRKERFTRIRKMS